MSVVGENYDNIAVAQYYVTHQKMVAAYEHPRLDMQL